MTGASDNFEAFLRSGLKGAAAGAPQAPSVFVIHQTLRRRKLTRAAWMSVAAALFLCVCLFVSPMLTSQEPSLQTAMGYWRDMFFPSPPPFVPGPGPNPTNLPSAEGVPRIVDEGHPIPVTPPETPPATPQEPQTALVAALQPLTDEADMFALRASLGKYFAAHGIVRAEISKEPGEQIDFILRADGIVDFAQVSIDIESLLRNYSRASVTFKAGDVTCWLLAPALRLH